MNRQKIAKSLTSSIVDGQQVLDEFQYISDGIDEINERIEELNAKKNKLMGSSQPIKDMYGLAIAMRKELGKTLKVLKRYGIEPHFSNDLDRRANSYLSCSCFLKRDDNEIGLISFHLYLHKNNMLPELEIEFYSWRREGDIDVDFVLEIQGDTLLKNTFAKWKKYLANVQKRFEDE